ncbi:MAG: GNAT family N-acetyltransferase [Actinobacteria bacterium]|nr:GNAT family N-acetyltransferase [Actinomycetota bacterium]
MLTLQVARIDEAPGTTLAQALLDELVVRYGAEDEHDGLHPDQLAPPSGTFIVAWLDDDAVGCGGLRRIDDSTGEIKRMFVAEAARRRGVAQAVLAELETTARAVGYQRLILETGTAQPEAIALYEADGYESIEPYGVYKSSPLSRCYAKNLR